MKETYGDKIKETDSDSGAIIQTKNSKNNQRHSKSQLKVTDRDKIKETESDSGAIIQMKNAYSARKKLKVKQMNPVTEAK